MAAGSSQDLTYRIISTTEGDGFSKTVEEAHKAADELEELLRKAEEVDEKDVEVKAKADTGEAEAKLKELKKSEDDAGNSASGAGGGMGDLGGKIGMLSAKAIAAADVLTVLPAAFAGLASAGATLSLGFGGIISALHDYGQASGAAGVSSAQLAQTAFSNAVAIRNAQDQITQARTSAAQQAASSANSLVSAEESLQNAEQSETQAQLALTQARQDASRSLIQANEAASTAALNVQAAQIAVTEAQKQQIQTDNSLTANALDKEKAALAVAQAQNNLVDVTEKAKETQQDANTANAKGVEGSKQVVTAKQAEAKAVQGVQDAQRALANTQRQAADAQAASAQQIAKAVQSLADTQKQQALAAASAATSAGGGMNQFARDMAKLTPIGREFVDRIIGMKGAFDQLRATAQNSMLPGFMPLLDGLQASMPGINGEIGAMGHIIGGLATQLGLLVQNPVFRGQLGQVFKDGNGLIAQFGSGVILAFQGIISAVSQAGPAVQGLGTAFHDILASGIPALFQGLVANAGGTGQAFAALGGILADLGGPLGQVVGALSGALGPVLAALRPVISQVVTTFVAALLPVLPRLTTALLAVVNVMAQLLPILMPLLPVIANGLASALQIIAPILNGVAGFLHDNVRWLTPLAELILGVVAAIKAWAIIQAAIDLLMTMNPIGLIVMALAGLVVGIVYCYEHFQTFRNIVNNVWHDLKQWFGVDIPQFFGKLLDFVKKWWPELLAPFTGGVSEIIGHWSDIIGYIGGIPGKLARAGAGMWDWIKDTFRSAINTVIGWWNGLQFTLPKVSTPLGDIGGGSIGVPSIPYLAAGGTVVGAGLAMVGEAGPELVQLGAGAQVHSNQASRALLGGQQQLPDRFVAEMTVKWPDGRVMDKQLVEFQRQGGVLQSVRVGALAALGTAAR